MKRIEILVKWKQVIDYPEYKISNNGLLLKNGVLQNALIENLGRKQELPYRYVNLRNPNKKQRTWGKKFFIHQLVWMHFGDNLHLNGLVIDHINHDVTDNRIENLQLLTRHQNLMKGKENALLQRSL